MALNAPGQQAMGAPGGAGIQNLDPKPGLLVKQTMKGCIQECMGCEANREYKIAYMDWSLLDGFFLKKGALEAPDEYYVADESSFLQRLCCPAYRSWVINVSEGANEGGPLMATYKKDFSCHPNCCCMLPRQVTMTPDGRELNSTRVICKCCSPMPQFAYEENGTDVYIIRPPLCCLGMCVQPECSKGCKRCMALPYYYYDAETGERCKGGDDNSEPMIMKVWSGFKKECCSTADNFAVIYPLGITPERKLGLLGATFMLDFVVFERQQEDAQ